MKKLTITFFISALLAFAAFMGCNNGFNQQIYSIIEDITGFGPRVTGSDARDEAAMYVKEKMESYGLPEVWIDNTEGSYSWNVDEYDLIISGQSVSSFPVNGTFRPFSGTGPFSTGENGLTAEIIDVGDAFDENGNPTFNPFDVNGKIVLFNLRIPPVPMAALFSYSEFVYDPDQTLNPDGYLSQPYFTNWAAMRTYVLDELGAVGFVGVLVDYFDSNEYYNEDYSTYEGQEIGPPMPGLWITKSDGQTIRDSLALNSQATIKLRGSYDPAIAKTVIGFLPGKSEETIVVSSHYDSIWEGGVQDASGTAELLTLAKWAAKTPIKHREKSLMFVALDSHFTGYQAHMAFIDRYATSSNIISYVTVEHIAKEAVIADGKLSLTGRAQPRAIFTNVGPDAKEVIKKAITDNKLDRTVIMPVDTPLRIPTDAWVACGAGVPVVSLISTPIYLYDSADTIDMVAKNELGNVAITMNQIINDLSKMSADKISGQ